MPRSTVDVVNWRLLCKSRLEERDGRNSVGKSLQLPKSVTATVNLTENNSIKIHVTRNYDLDSIGKGERTR